VAAALRWRIAYHAIIAGKSTRCREAVHVPWCSRLEEVDVKTWS